MYILNLLIFIIINLKVDISFVGFNSHTAWYFKSHMGDNFSLTNKV